MCDLRNGVHHPSSVHISRTRHCRATVSQPDTALYSLLQAEHHQWQHSLPPPSPPVSEAGSRSSRLSSFSLLGSAARGMREGLRRLSMDGGAFSAHTQGVQPLVYLPPRLLQAAAKESLCRNLPRGRCLAQLHARSITPGGTDELLLCARHRAPTAMPRHLLT
jgi:hypothetical protein